MSATAPPPGSGSGEEENRASSPSRAGPQEEAQRQPPQSIRRAVTLMRVGAALTVFEVLLTFPAHDEIRDGVLAAQSGFSVDDADSFAGLTIALVVVLGLIAAALWLWMASANKAGRSWARIVATVLGGGDIVNRLTTLTGGVDLVLIINVLTIALSGYILYLLYRPASSGYYAAVGGERR